MQLVARLSCLALAVTYATTAGAQSVRGTVMGSGSPVPGLTVILLDSTSATAASALTDDRGEFQLKAARPGTYRLRTLRIGFRTTISPPFALAVGQDITRPLNVEEIRFLLDTVRVTGRNSCRMASDSAIATFAVWEQVRAALTAVQVTAQEQQVTSTIIAYERTLDRSSRRVREQTGAVNTALVTRPWHSLDPRELRRSGYVAEQGDGAMFYAPGIDVLLSQEFVEDHCFRFAATDDAGQLGISFEPVPERKRIAEITGTMWLDRATAELRRVDFGYVNAPRAHLDEAAGAMEFTRLKDGRWAISRWNIRMPVLLMGYSSGREARIAEYRVAGGELALALRGADTLFKRPPLIITGHVVDSLTDAAVPRARLSLAGTTLGATSDLAGAFLIGDVLPGDYTLEVRTASLDSVGAVSQTPVTITGNASNLRVRVPTGQQIASSLCGAAAVEASGIVIGSVSLRGDTVIPAGIRIAAEWQQPYMRVTGGLVERGSRARWVEARADARGRYRICGVPVNMALTLRAESDSAAVTNTVTIPPGGRMARADLTLDVQAERGGLFAGQVVADSSLTPLPDAEVLVPTANRRATTNERGAFRMVDVPAGRHRVEVRRKGYTLASTEIDFAANQVQQRRIVMQPGVLEEPAGGGTETNLIASFEENRKAGRGQFMTREDIAKVGTRRTSDVLTRVPGAAMVRGRSNAAFPGSRRAGGNAARGDASARSDAASGLYCPDDLEVRSGIECGCYSQVFVNNMLVNRGTPTPPFDVNAVPAELLEALEYYRSAAETPARYSGSAAQCGVLVLWTRRAP
jgi:hypothetical protein